MIILLTARKPIQHTQLLGWPTACCYNISFFYIYILQQTACECTAQRERDSSSSSFFLWIWKGIRMSSRLKGGERTCGSGSGKQLRIYIYCTTVYALNGDKSYNTPAVLCPLQSMSESLTVTHTHGRENSSACCYATGAAAAALKQ